MKHYIAIGSIIFAFSGCKHEERAGAGLRSQEGDEEQCVASSSAIATFGAIKNGLEDAHTRLEAASAAASAALEDEPPDEAVAPVLPDDAAPSSPSADIEEGTALRYFALQDTPADDTGIAAARSAYNELMQEMRAANTYFGKDGDGASPSDRDVARLAQTTDRYNTNEYFQGPSGAEARAADANALARLPEELAQTLATYDAQIDNDEWEDRADRLTRDQCHAVSAQQAIDERVKGETQVANAECEGAKLMLEQELKASRAERPAVFFQYEGRYSELQNAVCANDDRARENTEALAEMRRADERRTGLVAAVETRFTAPGCTDDAWVESFKKRAQELDHTNAERITAVAGVVQFCPEVLERKRAEEEKKKVADAESAYQEDVAKAREGYKSCLERALRNAKDDWKTSSFCAQWTRMGYEEQRGLVIKGMRDLCDGWLKDQAVRAMQATRCAGSSRCSFDFDPQSGDNLRIATKLGFQAKAEAAMTPSCN